MDCQHQDNKIPAYSELWFCMQKGSRSPFLTRVCVCSRAGAFARLQSSIYNTQGGETEAQRLNDFPTNGGNHKRNPDFLLRCFGFPLQALQPLPCLSPAPSKLLHTIRKQWHQGCWGSGRAVSISSAHFPFSSHRTH